MAFNRSAASITFARPLSNVKLSGRSRMTPKSKAVCFNSHLLSETDVFETGLLVTPVSGAAKVSRAGLQGRRLARPPGTDKTLE